MKHLLFLCLFPAVLQAAEVIEADLCIYGGTASGVSAAVQATRLGKKAVIAEFGNHLGGLTTGGLGATDIGNKDAIGGIAREFYRRLGQHYGKDEQWTFEPRVAEKILFEMVNYARAPVYFQQRLAAVRKEGERLTEITMENGKVFRAKMFIDASYEGDLMAKAGVSYMVGREANSVYDETLNGVRAQTPFHQFTVPVDPYRTPGDPQSGLLPFIQQGDGGKPGEGDRSVQAYNFRLCLTKDPQNKKRIEPPPKYKAEDYELLARYLEALTKAGKKPQLSQFLLIKEMPNKKTDMNNNGAFSTDFIGMNYDYPDADYPTRERIWKAHENYTRGFLHFLATDPRAPAALREETASWGLAADEFVDTDGWPHQLYVREARRMVSDYVMTEHNCRGAVKAEDPVGLGAYNMDSHNCQRIVKEGRAHNEGDVQVGVRPYPISYRSIIPKAGQCENLLVPVCLAASHIAFGSIRMEPVFMIMGQSAATAASMAIDEKVPVQQLSYDRLRTKLLADKQILDWTGRGAGSASAKTVSRDPKSLPGIVLDDVDGFKVGPWQQSVASGIPHLGPGYLHDNNANKGQVAIIYNPEIPEAAEYEIVISSPPHENRARNAQLTIAVKGRAKVTLPLNQQIKANDGLTSIGKFNLPAGKLTSITLSNADSDGHVVADGIQLLKVQK